MTYRKLGICYLNTLRNLLDIDRLIAHNVIPIIIPNFESCEFTRMMKFAINGAYNECRSFGYDREARELIGEYARELRDYNGL